MSSVILKAHYDGRQIVLDEPFDLPANCPLGVLVLSAEAQMQQEHADWAALAAAGLARAYGDNEPEYTLADLKR